jgi:hypothetical protein
MDYITCKGILIFFMEYEVVAAAAVCYALRSLSCCRCSIITTSSSIAARPCHLRRKSVCITQLIDTSRTSWDRIWRAGRVRFLNDREERQHRLGGGIWLSG